MKFKVKLLLHDHTLLQYCFALRVNFYSKANMAALHNSDAWQGGHVIL